MLFRVSQLPLISYPLTSKYVRELMSEGRIDLAGLPQSKSASDTVAKRFSFRMSIYTRLPYLVIRFHDWKRPLSRISHNKKWISRGEIRYITWET